MDGPGGRSHPTDQIVYKGWSRLQEAALPRIRGQAIIQILNVSSLFCMKMDERFSALGGWLSELTPTRGSASGARWGWGLCSQTSYRLALRARHVPSPLTNPGSAPVSSLGYLYQYQQHSESNSSDHVPWLSNFTQHFTRQRRYRGNQWRRSCGGQDPVTFWQWEGVKMCTDPHFLMPCCYTWPDSNSMSCCQSLCQWVEWSRAAWQSVTRPFDSA